MQKITLFLCIGTEIAYINYMKQNKDNDFSFKVLPEPIIYIEPFLPNDKTVAKWNVDLNEYKGSDISLLGNDMGGIDTSSEMTICYASVHPIETFEFENNWIIASQGNHFTNDLIVTHSNWFPQVNSNNIFFSFSDNENIISFSHQGKDSYNHKLFDFKVPQVSTTHTDNSGYFIYIYQSTFLINYDECTGSINYYKNKIVFIKKTLLPQGYRRQHYIQSGRELVTHIQHFRE